MTDHEKHFYLFRHGECPLNKSGHIQGRTIDGELTPRGKQQARKVGRILRNKSVEIIFSSPMKRAIQTADIVSHYVHVSIITDARLTEVNMGEVEGLHITEVEQNFGEIYQRWRNCTLDDTSTRFAGGETKAEVRARVFEALNDYAASNLYHNIAVSCHGIVISQILLYMGIEKSDIPNGAVMELKNNNRNWIYNGFLE